MENSTKLECGKELEGYAFTFCKAAFLALLFGKYAVLVLSVAAVVLYGLAYAAGVREYSGAGFAAAGDCGIEWAADCRDDRAWIDAVADSDTRGVR